MHWLTAIIQRTPFDCNLRTFTASYTMLSRQHIATIC